MFRMKMHDFVTIKTYYLNKLKQIFPAIIAVIVLYAFFHIIGIGCPIKYFTGISCAGCGMTRAWMNFLSGNFFSAFYFHPLFLLPIPVTLIILFHEKIPEKIFRNIIIVAIILFILIYLTRMLDTSNSVVIFDPKSGLIFRILQHLFF